MIDRDRATRRVTRRSLIVAGFAAGACWEGVATARAAAIAPGSASEKPALHDFVHADISDYLIGL